MAQKPTFPPHFLDSANRAGATMLMEALDSVASSMASAPEDYRAIQFEFLEQFAEYLRNLDDAERDALIVGLHQAVPDAAD